MIREDFKSLYLGQMNFFYDGSLDYLKQHLKKIIRDELENFYLKNYPQNWIYRKPLPADLRMFINDVIKTKKYDQIHDYKDQGVKNTKWDYTEVFKLIQDYLSQIYQENYGNFDPDGRSLINFLETHEQAIWEIIDYFQKKGYDLDFMKNRMIQSKSIDLFRKILHDNAHLIFYQHTELFPMMIKEIITTKAKGKNAVHRVKKDLDDKGINYILTDSGDLMDIEQGIDLIIIGPIPELIGNTMQIKTSNSIIWNHDKVFVQCDSRSVKYYSKNVDFLTFKEGNKVRYFRNKKGSNLITKEKDGYIFDNSLYVEDLSNLTKKSILTI